MVVKAKKTNGMWFVKDHRDKIVKVFYNYKKAINFNKQLMARIEEAIFKEMEDKND